MYIVHSVHYNTIITIETNERTQLYQNHNNITTHQLLLVSGLSDPYSWSTHLYKQMLFTIVCP